MPLDHPEDRELQRSTNHWMLAGTLLLFAFVFAFPIYRALEPGGRSQLCCDPDCHACCD